MKSQGFGIVIHNDLTANILMANTEWTEGQLWGNEIRVAYCNIKRQYKYSHAHTATSLKDIKRATAVVDK